MKSLFWFAVLCLALSSCKSVKPLPTQKQTTVTTERDSTATRTEERDSLLILREAQTLQLTKAITSLSEEPMYQRAGGTTLSLRRVGDRIEAECHTEELKEVIQLQREIIEFYRVKETTTETETTVIEKEMPGWAKPFLWLGIGIAILMLVSTYAKFKGKLSPL